MCPSHVQELRLYCPADQCKKAICLKCLIKDHAAHAADVEDLTEKKERLLANINSVSKDLEKAKTDCLKIKEFASKENEKCIASIKARKEEICAEFDAMMEEVSDFTPEVIQTIQTFEEFLTSLEKMGSCQMSFEEIRADSESVENIRKASKKKLSNTIQYYKYSRNSVFGELKITTAPLDSAVKENTETKAVGGSTGSGNRGNGNEREVLNKPHSSDRNDRFSKGRNREEGIGDSKRDCIENEDESGIDGPQDEAERDALHHKDGKERYEERRRGDGSNNERGRDGLHSDGRSERDGSHNEDGRGKDGPSIDRSVSFEDASGSEGGNQTTNASIQGPPRKRPRKGSPVQILGLPVITTMKTWSSAYSALFKR